MLERMKKAFEAGVKEALDLFKGPVTPEKIAESAKKVIKTTEKAVNAARKLKK